MLCLQWPTPRLWEPHHRWNYLSCETFSSVLQLVCLIILEREKCILFIRSEIIDFMVNFRQVPPTSQMRTYLASPMDWMPLGNSCLIPHPPKKPSLSTPNKQPLSVVIIVGMAIILLIVPPLLLYHPPQTCAIQHGRRGMRRRRHNGADRLLHVSYTSVAEREWSTWGFGKKLTSSSNVRWFMFLERYIHS